MKDSSLQRSARFSRLSFFLILLFVAVSCALGYSISSFDGEDFTLYHQLMAEADPTITQKDKKTPYLANQHQEKVRKDFFVVKDQYPLHLFLTSSDVNVTLDHQHGKSELTEELAGVSSLAQEKLYYADKSKKKVADSDPEAYPMQTIYRTEADRAFFSYNSNFLKAENVRVSGHEAEGHSLSEDLFATLQEPILTVDAVQAYYDGKSVTLDGDVHVEHVEGSAAAQKMVLHPSSTEKSSLFDTITMEDNVTLYLKGKGILSCQRAEFDKTTLKGHFFGGTTKDTSILFQSLPDEKNKTHDSPFILKSHNAELSLKVDPVDNSKKAVDTLIANGDVSLDWGKKLFFLADRATYKHHLKNLDLELQTNLPGNITLESNAPEKNCCVTTEKGDELIGEKFDINLNRRRMSVHKPKGYVNISSNDAQDKRNLILDYSADTLIWNGLNKNVKLKGNIEVKHSELGLLTCDRELDIFYFDDNGKKQLQTVKANGYSVLRHEGKQVEQTHWLTCQGSILLDHTKNEIHCKSLKNKSTQEKKQVFYYDTQGEAQADKITIFYKYVEGALTPMRVLLEGNVYLVDHKGMESSNGVKSAPLHYALADKVEYTPHNKEIYFSSQAGRRVLFYDKINEMQVSAPALKVTRNEATKKESIKGLGDVRFHFLNSELEELLKRR